MSKVSLSQQRLAETMFGRFRASDTWNETALYLLIFWPAQS
jgi:hypothetical protein